MKYANVSSRQIGNGRVAPLIQFGEDCVSNQWRVGKIDEITMTIASVWFDDKLVSDLASAKRRSEIDFQSVQHGATLAHLL